MRSIDSQSRGFSLLEMVVAIAILAVSLVTLYQATSGATRNVRADEKYAYGVELARSLLAANAMVPAAGMTQSGETKGEFAWEVLAQPVSMEQGMAQGVLQEIEVSVAWRDGGKRREVRLHSIVEGYGQ